MQVECYEKLTKANIIIAYELSSESAKAKTDFMTNYMVEKGMGFFLKYRTENWLIV